MVQPPRTQDTAPIHPRAPTIEQESFIRLIAPVKRPWVTYALVAINVAVGAAMIASGASPTLPSLEDTVAWGASAGVLVFGGQWWRLYSANYVHVGLIHLFFNMYVLFRAGPTVEKIFGHAGYAICYAFAGFAGSVASALWNPNAASAGASGAVFGIFGALGAFLVRRRSLMPRSVLVALRGSAVSFILFNIAFGFAVSGVVAVDQAAHIGGLAGGFLAGLALAPGVDDRGPRRPYALYAVPIAIMIAATALIAFLPAA
jgi:rhomboid protease GluP